MIRTIAEKEFFLIVKTLRFLVVILLCLLILPISVWTLSSDFNKERKDYFGRLDVESRNERKESRLNLFRPVPSLYPFVRGIDDEAVNCVSFHFRSWNRQSTESTQSKTHMIIPTVDMAFLVGIVLSGLAFLLSHDAISGEKGGRTLSLISSSPAPRSSVVIGKWIGISAALLIPFLLGFCLSVLLFAFFTGANLASGDYLALALLFLLSALYIAAITIIGVAISALTQNQSTSLFLCLGIWGLICFILPQTANAAATGLHPLAPPHELQRQLRVVENDGLRRLAEDNMQLIETRRRNGWTSSREYDPYRRINYLNMAGNNREGFISLENQFSRESRIQEEISSFASLLSPYGCFKQAVMSLAGTGPDSHRSFVDEAYRFGELYFRQIISTWRENPAASSEELISGLPQFNYRGNDLNVRIGKATLPAGVLVLVIIVFIAAAVFAFNRYDVR